MRKGKLRKERNCGEIWSSKLLRAQKITYKQSTEEVDEKLPPHLMDNVLAKLAGIRVNQSQSTIDAFVGQRLQSLIETAEDEAKLIQALGFDHRTLHEVCCGQRRLRAREMLAVTSVFGVSVGYFFDGFAAGMVGTKQIDSIKMIPRG